MDPLSLNRLTYARNNPTSFTDPSGLCLEDACVLEGAAAYWVLSGGAVLGVGALAVTADQVSHVLSDAYVQQRLVEWSSDRGANFTQNLENLHEFLARGGSLRPDPTATGPHSTFRRDQGTGQVNHYVEWQPKQNPHPQDPQPWEPAKRYDGPGSPAHRNSTTGQYVPSPHVHDTAETGGVRPAQPEEIPGVP